MKLKDYLEDPFLDRLYSEIKDAGQIRSILLDIIAQALSTRLKRQRSRHYPVLSSGLGARIDLGDDDSALVLIA